MADINLPMNTFGKILTKVSGDDSMILGQDFKQSAGKCTKVFVLYLQTM